MDDSSPAPRRTVRRVLLSLVLIPLVLLLLVRLLQGPWAHRDGQYFPPGDPVPLESILQQDSLSPADFGLLYAQTGLSPTAVCDLLDQGEPGIRTILQTQKGFFAHHPGRCLSLLPGRFTCEDRLVDSDGSPIAAVPLAPLQPGDILLTFSTHSLGWRHGHAGLVIDPDAGTVLEAARLGADTYQSTADRWRSYSSFLVLRVRDASDQVRQQVADFALSHLDGVPYSLLSGLTGSKKTPQQEPIRVQCAYLPWLAWLSAGVDLDGDGGRLVSVHDLIESPALELVQFYGVDPAAMAARVVLHPDF